MRLLRFADLQTSLHWLNQLDLMMDKVENIDRILDSDWLMWCHSYLQADSDVEDPSHMQRVLAKFYSVLQKTIIRGKIWLLPILDSFFFSDLARPVKQCELVKLKEFPETSDFFLIVFENILDYFEQHPRVEAAFAAQLLRNLGLVFDYVESVIGLPPGMCVRAISVINLLASQNESTIRGRMKDSGLFDIRDNIVLRCIREEMPQEVRLDTFCVVSFEMVAVQPIFRDSGSHNPTSIFCHDCGNISRYEDHSENLTAQVELCVCSRCFTTAATCSCKKRLLIFFAISLVVWMLADRRSLNTFRCFFVQKKWKPCDVGPIGFQAAVSRPRA